MPAVDVQPARHLLSSQPMCGICGSTRDAEGTAVAAMNARLVHRGPDDDGVYVDPDAGVALGARRLSVIDVEGGHQPVSNEDGTIWATLNGEIYNHPALREHLLGRGHHLRSRTDTEVLVHLYEEYGDALVHALEGMFAFAIWDTRKRRLLVARDRFGEKPLFYRDRGGTLTFASELTALLAGSDIPRELDTLAIDEFFVFGYVPGPQTLVPGVRQLPPAHTMVWSAGQPTAKLTCYWRSSDVAAPVNESLRQLTEETARLLRISVKARLIADVPLGVLLSGGLDSSLIAILAAEVSAKPIKTFTVGYDVGGVAETAPARRTAQEIASDHHELILREADVAASVPGLLAGLDQPMADQALVATHAIARFARREVTVAVGGEGADELFGGYPRYRWLRRAASLERAPAPVRAGAASLVRAIAGEGRISRLVPVLEPQTTAERHIDWVTAGRRHRREELYGPALAHTLRADSIVDRLSRLASDDFRRGAPDAAMRLDQVHWLPDDVLTKADRASMLNSLELRTPYLHRQLAEFAGSIPPSAHVGRNGKRLLRSVAESVGLSAATRGKTAFRVPAGDWLRGPLRPTLEAQVRDGVIYERELFSRQRVGALVQAHMNGDADCTQVLWPLLALGVWADHFLGAHGA